eukprot:1066416-Rhodomonas_salina.2
MSGNATEFLLRLVVTVKKGTPKTLAQGRTREETEYLPLLFLSGDAMQPALSLSRQENSASSASASLRANIGYPAAVEYDIAADCPALQDGTAVMTNQVSSAGSLLVLYVMSGTDG